MESLKRITCNLYPKQFSLLWSLLFFSFVSSAQIPYTSHPGPVGMAINTSRVNELVVDANNNKWFAFGNYGVGIYDGNTWTIIDSTSGSLPTDSVISIAFESSGNAWIGTKMGAVYKSGSSYTLYHTGNSGLPQNIITKILYSPGKTWFGTDAGLVSFDGSTWSLYNSINSGLANDSITCLKTDASGKLWIGTRNGLSSFDGNNWNTYNTVNSPLNRYITDLECDQANRIWVSCGTLTPFQYPGTSGLFYILNGQIYEFESDFYMHDLSISIMRIIYFAKDSNGDVFFRHAVNDKDGLFRISGNSYTYYYLPGINNGLSLSGSFFEMDLTGTLWTVPRRYFYLSALDISGYQVPPLNQVNFHNFRLLDINDVEAGINTAGDMHWDCSNARYTVPKESGKQSVFASALWIGGLDSSGLLHVAGHTYRQTGNDFWPGPIDEISIPFDSTSCQQFDRIWKIDKWKVEEFKNAFSAGSVSNGTYSVPEEISSWPAKGNGVVIGDLASFVDVNSDGNYNPLQGDYPLIKGDQMLFHIFNDSLSSHSETNGLKLGVEVHVCSYAFNCYSISDSMKVLNRTTLYNYKIINRSQIDYDSVYTGFWCDNDLGYPDDDYLGCDTLRSAGFVYNGDNNDETQVGYGVNPPMQNVKVLRGTLADAGDGLDNDLDGIVDEPNERTTMNHLIYYYNVNNVPTGNPNGPWDYYNYMHSIWQDGSHLSYGGDGLDTLAPLTNFMFSGVPYSANGWTELSLGNPTGDRRFIMSSGPVSFDAGDTLEFDIAYVFTWDSLSPNGLNTSIARNQADLDRVQHWFDTDSFPSCENYTVGIPQNPSDLNQVMVYPNPARNFIYLYDSNQVITDCEYSIFNLVGQEVKSGKLHSNRIDIGGLSSQPYFIRLNLSGKMVVKKFVKIE